MKIPIRKGVAVKLLVFSLALLIGIAAYLYSMRSRSVLYRIGERGDPVKEPAFSLFNPFRDRAPERSAEAFLTLLMQGQCAQATSVLPATPEDHQERCEREANSPLMAWQLTNRSDNSQAIRMSYRAQRRSYDGYQGQLWITVEKRGGDWQVTKYECFY